MSMQLLKFSFLSKLKQILKIKRINHAVKKMLKKNDKENTRYIKNKNYYEENYPQNSIIICTPDYFAVNVENDDIILNQADAENILKSIGFHNPTFLEISIIDDDLNHPYETRAFFKYDITPSLYAYATIGNTNIFIIDKRYDKTNVSYTLKDNECNDKTFTTSIIYSKRNMQIYKKPLVVQLTFKVVDSNIAIKKVECTDTPSFPWNPVKEYHFAPDEDEEKIKRFIMQYYRSYFFIDADCVQDFPYHYSINV